jgi:hypothetical protein
MTKPMSLTDRLSGLKLPSHFGKGTRARRRRVNKRWQVEAQISPLEERCMLAAPAGIPLPTPAGGFVAPSSVMYQTNSTLKTITIHNNTNQTLFPFVEDVNIGQNPNNNNAYYDPNDTPNIEYRLYAGYVAGGKNFLGIKPNASITLTLPMVFWNAGTIQVVADTPATRARFLQPLNPGGNALGRPFLYNKSGAKEAVVPTTATGEQGMELMYHTTNQSSKGVISDAPSQLLEFTITDPSVPNGSAAPFTNTVDYDISYINHLYLPVAIEANKPGVGYVGTLKTLAQFDPAVQAFENGTILNGYFGGKGWPFYYTSNPINPTGPVNKNALIKLVGTQNIFSDNTSASSYNLLHSSLSSSAGNKASKGVIKPTNGDYAEQDLINYWFGWLKYYETTPGAQPITGNLEKLMTQGGLPVTPVTITPDPTKMWTVNGSNTPVSDTQFANAFAYTVYQVMSAFSNASNIVYTNPAQPALRTFMADIIGNTISLVFPDAKSAQAILLTQEEVALLQGEPNTSVQVLSPGQPNYSLPLGPNGLFPYPTPAGPTNAALWTVGKYNLDPFVWFVHDYLGAYSYAFSVDDQYGNVLVGNATGFQVAVGGPEGIVDQTPFKTGE